VLKVRRKWKKNEKIFIKTHGHLDMVWPWSREKKDKIRISFMEVKHNQEKDAHKGFSQCPATGSLNFNSGYINWEAGAGVGRRNNSVTGHSQNGIWNLE